MWRSWWSSKGSGGRGFSKPPVDGHRVLSAKQLVPQHQQHPLPATQVPVTQIPVTHSPVFNHQAYAYMLQKQRAVLQMRQLLNINPDANTWPLEWRQALQALLQQ